MQKQYHIVCVGASSELPLLLKDTPGLTWKCRNCNVYQELFDEKKLLTIFEDKIKSFFMELNETFVNIKSELLKKAEDKLSTIITQADSPTTSTQKPSYSAALCNNFHAAVVVKPKNSQENEQTKSDILQSINVSSSDININRIKHIKDGGLVVGCKTTEEVSKFKDIIEQKMSSGYDIREVKGLHPRVRIVGLSQTLNTDTLLKLVRKQNNEIFDDNSECTVTKLWQTKNNNHLYQAVLQLDIATYNKVINNGYLLVGLDLCKVYDAIDILRCFNCNGFNHSKNVCKKELTCPNCSLNHAKELCKAVNYKCINCINLKESKKVDIDIDHAAWDHVKCQSYKNSVLKLKTDLGYQ